MRSCIDVVKLVIDPPMIITTHGDKPKLQSQASIQISNTLECIWNLRNKMVHSPGPLNLPLYIRNLELHISEHLSILAIPKVSTATFSKFWKPPPAGTIKLNTDAAVRSHSSSLAVMACNHLGAVVKAWACKSLIDDPTIAEAYAIKWALSLAKDECFSHFIVESDSKSYIEAFSGSSADVYWEINAFML